MAKLSIRFRTGPEPKSLELYVKKQLGDFFRKNTAVSEADVKLSRDLGVDNSKTCEIYLKTDHKNMFTIQKGSAFENSVTKALNRLQMQLDAASLKISNHDQIQTEQPEAREREEQEDQTNG